MNNLAYTKQKSEDVAPKIEEIVRKDLGVNGTLPYSIAEAGTAMDALSSIAADAKRFLFGGSETVLFTQKFDIASPRPITIEMNVNRQGIGCHVGSITFTAYIKKTVSGEVSLEAPKTFGTSKFVGDANVAGKLNNNKDLLKACDKLARTKSDLGGGIKMERYCKVIPSADGAYVVIITLGRATSMGMSATTDVKDFFTVVGMIEAAL